MDRLRKILINTGIGIIGLGIGFLIVLAFNALDYTQRIIAAVAIIAAAVCVFVVWGLSARKQNQKVTELLDILYGKLDTKKFIEETLAILETVKNKSYRKTLMLNLAVGYESDCQFDKAIETMKEISIKGADSTLKAMYYCNLSCFYAESRNNDAALITFSQGEKFVNQSEKKLPAANLLLTKGIIAFAEGEYKKSERCFKSAKAAGFEEKQLSYYADVYLGKIYKEQGNEKEAQNIFARISRKKVLPYIMSAVQAELNA